MLFAEGCGGRYREGALRSDVVSSCGADRPSTAVAQVALGQFDAMVVNITGTKSEEMTFLARVRGIAGHLPVVVVLDTWDDALVARALQLGVEDFVSKEEVLEGRLERAIRMGVGRKEARGRLEFLAHYHPLTGLPNRTLSKTV